MIEDSAPRPAALARRLRAWLGLPSDARLPRPRAERLDPLHRTWTAAAWQARSAVQARIPLEDFLRARLARYLVALPVPRAVLPLAVEVRNGELAVLAVEHELPPPAAGQPWFAPLLALEGPAVRDEVDGLEHRLGELETQATEARRRAEDLRRRLATDVAAGAVAGPPAVVATPEQLGRPPVPSASRHAGLVGLAAASLAAETWQLALPLLRAAGVDPARLRVELGARPAEVLLTGAYALGVAVALFALAHASVEGAARRAGEQGGAQERRWRGAGAALGGVGAAVVASAAAALPARGGPGWGAVALLLAVPLGASLLLRRADRAREVREAALGAALAWDRERARQLADRARRLDEVSASEAAVHALQREREAVRDRLRALARRARDAARLGDEAARREQRALARLAQSLVSALELDLHEFVRQASARGATELLASRRKAPEPPRSVPSVLEPAADGGRLAG